MYLLIDFCAFKVFALWLFCLLNLLCFIMIFFVDISLVLMISVFSINEKRRIPSSSMHRRLSVYFFIVSRLSSISRMSSDKSDPKSFDVSEDSFCSLTWLDTKCNREQLPLEVSFLFTSLAAELDILPLFPLRLEFCPISLEVNPLLWEKVLSFTTLSNFRGFGFKSWNMSRV